MSRNVSNSSRGRRQGGVLASVIDDTAVSFPIVTPDALDIAYEIELSDDDCRLIGLEDVRDAAALDQFTGESAEDGGGAPSGRVAANTRSPVILNLKTRLGMQKILHEIHPSLLYRAR